MEHREQAAEEIPEPPETDLSSVLAAVQASLSGAIAAARAEISAGPLPRLSVKETEMASLLQNLIGNAITYRRPGIEARIAVHAEGRRED